MGGAGAASGRTIGAGAGFGAGGALGVAGAAAGFGPDIGVTTALGDTGPGLVWTGVGAAGLDGGAGVAGLGAMTVAGFGGAAGADFAVGGVAAGFGGTAAGFALASGGGPNVMRGRSGNAAFRGKETGGFSGAIAGEITDPSASREIISGHSKGRKSATAGSGGSAGGATDSMSASVSASPNPVVLNLDETESFQRMAGEKSIAVRLSSVLAPFWFPTVPSRYSEMGRP